MRAMIPDSAVAASAPRSRERERVDSAQSGFTMLEALVALAISAIAACAWRDLCKRLEHLQAAGRHNDTAPTCALCGRHC